MGFPRWSSCIYCIYRVDRTTIVRAAANIHRRYAVWSSSSCSWSLSGYRTMVVISHSSWSIFTRHMSTSRSLTTIVVRWSSHSWSSGMIWRHHRWNRWWSANKRSIIWLHWAHWRWPLHSRWHRRRQFLLQRKTTSNIYHLVSSRWQLWSWRLNWWFWRRDDCRRCQDSWLLSFSWRWLRFSRLWCNAGPWHFLRSPRTLSTWHWIRVAIAFTMAFHWHRVFSW